MKADGLAARARVRVAPHLPYAQDFSKVPEGAVPAGWVNTQGKFRVGTYKGEKVLMKVNDKGSPLVAKGNAYIGMPTLKNYTIESDVMGGQVGSDLPDMGVVGNRYTLVLAGNIQKLRITSWDALPRIDRTIEYPWQPNVWYRLKLTVEVTSDIAIVKGKCWKRGDTEPAEWTIQVERFAGQSRRQSRALWLRHRHPGDGAGDGHLLRQCAHYTQQEIDPSFGNLNGSFDMASFPNLKRWLAFGITGGIFVALLVNAGLGRSSSRAQVTTQTAPAATQDHPMFGGTNFRNMVNTVAKNVPVKWSVEEGSPDVKWVADLGSKAYGGPVVSGGKVLVGTNNNKPRDKKFIGAEGRPIDMGVVMAFNEADGKFLWQNAFHKLAAGRVMDWPGEGICSTPLMAGKEIYYVSNRCEVVCVDPEGKYLWKLDMIKELGVFPHNLADCSPLLVDDNSVGGHLQRRG